MALAIMALLAVSGEAQMPRRTFWRFFCQPWGWGVWSWLVRFVVNLIAPSQQLLPGHQADNALLLLVLCRTTALAQDTGARKMLAGELRGPV